MKTYLDCFPCILRQTLEAARYVNTPPEQVELLFNEVFDRLGEFDRSTPPPVMGGQIHRRIRELTGNQDPYLQVKRHFNVVAQQVLPDLVRRGGTAVDPLETAVRLAIGGNIIDFGVGASVTEEVVRKALDESLSQPLLGDLGAFRQAIEAAGQILYLLDNAGEIVFDRHLIEALPKGRVTAVVRGSPVLNDVTHADAEQTGLKEIVRVIDNGTDQPGTFLQQCSPEFLEAFAQADLVIAKGQGNYESLSPSPKHTFFLLKAKCVVIARDIGCPQGSLVMHEERGPLP